MPPKRLNRNDKLDDQEARARTVQDPARAAFTFAIVTALQELECKKALSKDDLGRLAYQKLQYDLPLVSTEELAGLAQMLRESLQMKSSQPTLPLTSKLLENIVTGARAPVASLRPPANAAQQQASDAIASTAGNVTASEPSTAAGTTAATVRSVVGRSSHAAETDPAATTSTSEQPVEAAPPLPSTLLQADPLGIDQQGLSSAYRALCATVFVPLVSHCLTVSELDTWVLIHAIAAEQGDEDEGGNGASDEQPQGSEAGWGPDGTSSGGDFPAAPQIERQSVQERVDGPQPDAATGTVREAVATRDVDVEEQVNGRVFPRESNGMGKHADRGAKPGCGAEAASPGPEETQTTQIVSKALSCLSVDDGGWQREADAPSLQAQQRQQLNPQHNEAVAAEEDGDDFVFEALEAPAPATVVGPSGRTPASASAPSWLPGATTAASATSPAPAPYTWPALHRRLLLLSSHVSYALLDDPALWRDGQLLQGIFQLLRALGAHRHAQELQPLLHAYVGLVADRLAAAPEELGCLDSLWDAVGVPCIASLPQQVGRQRATANGSSGRGPGGQVLLAEASTCLSLVASLAGQLTAASARLRLWQQIHGHMLPLLERCLGELARSVRQGPGGPRTVGPDKAAAPDAKAPGPEEVAAIVLVCQVLDFYVQQRPGNADLVSALKGTGVLASLSVLFAAGATLLGAEPLRSAALCCAASSRELHSWMMAVPGVAQAVRGPLHQEGAPYEAHGAVWELLGNNGVSSLALSILSDGATPEKAVRVYALLQLLGKAAACRGGSGGALWNPPVERALRELFAALRGGQAAGPAPLTASRTAAKGQAGSGNCAGAAEAPNGASREDPSSGRDEEGEQSCAELEVDDDEEKLQILDPAALQRRHARQLHPACWRILKQLLTTEGESGGKTD